MSSWPQVALHYLVRFRNGADYKDVEDADGTVPVIGSGGPFTTASAYLYDGESVLFGRKGTVDRPRYETGKFWTVDTMFYTELSERVVGRWLYYWATTIPFDLLSTNTALPSMTSSVLGRLRVSVPPVAEQRVIADFLDRETGKIDALIEKQTELITRLHERRRLVVDHALLGLKQRPSAIRRHWTVTDCKHVTAVFEDDGEYPVASIGQVQRDFVDLSNASRVNGEWYSVLTEGGRRPQPGDLVMSRNATVGATAEVSDTADEFALGQDVVLLRARDNSNPAFLRYCMRSSIADDGLALVMVGSTFKRVNVAQIKALRFPFPAVDVQGVVAARLERETSKIDELIGKTERMIELSKERRSALITAAVTGQIDVNEHGGAA